MVFTCMPCARRAPSLYKTGRVAGSSQVTAEDRRRAHDDRSSLRRQATKAKAVAEFQLVVLIPGFGTRFPARGAMNEQQACFDGVTWSDHVEHPTSCRGHYERPDHGGRSSELLLFRWGGLFSRC